MSTSGFFNNVKENLLGKKRNNIPSGAGTRSNERGASSVTVGGYSPEVQFYDTSSLTVRKNWYKQLPYSFVFKSSISESETEFYLPISPSNISIVTHFATNVISTMYGTVEEHSEQRYFDITISGTTGMLPRYYDNTSHIMQDRAAKATKQAYGRAGFEVRKTFGNNPLGGFFRRTIGLVENAINQANELFSNGDDPSRRASTGADIHKTGYVAFHNLYKFLLTYKLDTSAQGSKSRTTKNHPLAFRNYKDGNQYDVSINNFTLTRDASNPMMYNYNITMRAYNLRPVNSDVVAGLEVTDTKARLGLAGDKDGENSFFSQMSNKTNKAKNAAFSALGAIKGFGR